MRRCPRCTRWVDTRQCPCTKSIRWEGPQTHRPRPRLRALPALGVLNAAILDRHDATGWRPACTGPESALWTSEEPEDLDQATRLCQGCPVTVECLAAGQASPRPRTGVWGGKAFQDWRP